MDYPISTVHLCDCIDFMRSCKDNQFDLCIADPPYGINAPNMKMGEHKGYQSTASKVKGRLNQGAGKLKNRALNTLSCEWDFYPPTQEYFEEIFRISKKSNHLGW